MTAQARSETVRALLATVGENDVDTALALVTSDLSFVDVLAPLESTVRDVHGEAGLRDWFAGLHQDGVKRVGAEPFDLQDLGDDRVVGGVRVTIGNADGSFAMVVYGIWEFAGDAICRIHSYFDRELALRDAGLSPESGLMRRWVEAVIREMFPDRRAVSMDAPEFDGNEFSVAGDVWDELSVGAEGLAEIEHGQLITWQPFDAFLPR